ncbi:MAG: cyclase family protein [Lachnospiraceae bacterium]
MKLDLSQIFDISMPITYDMPVYAGDQEKRPVLEIQSDFHTSTIHESRIHMNLHTGTHMDRTLHMMPEGNTIETLPFGDMITRCRVLDLTDAVDRIDKKDLTDQQIQEGEFILLKTKNSSENILQDEFIYLAKDAAAFLAEQKIKGVGIDALGVERGQPGHETHLTLMHQGIHILEGLRLKEIEAGEYFLSAVPVNIVGAEAAPIRAYLVSIQED